MRSIILMVWLSLTIGVATALAQVPDYTESFDKGVKLARANEFSSAIAEFRTILGGVGNDEAKLGQIHFNIGACLYRLGSLDEAVSELTQAIMYRPDYERAFYSLGMAEYGRRRFAAAQEAFVQALHIDRRNAETWYDLGYALIAQEKFEGAAAAFERASKYKSIDTAKAHNNVGVILAMSHKFRQAEAEFQKALNVSRGLLEVAQNNLAICRRLMVFNDNAMAANLSFGVDRSEGE
ncbi:MAG: tetratricopeptide repeat protein [Acidobacteriota bacterium]